MAPQLAMKEADAPTPWLPEQKQDIIAKFKADWSMGEIAFAHGTTRSAIAGIISRLRKQNYIPPKRCGLKPGAKSRPVVKTAPKGKPVAVKPRKPPKRIRLKLVESAVAVTFAELEKHHCRWPIGMPGQSDFRYCGCQRISESSRTPYCEQHTLLARRNYDLAKR